MSGPRDPRPPHHRCPAGLPAAVGIGWRPALARFIERRAERIGFVEVLAEHIDPRRLPKALVALREKAVPIVVHGLELSLGGADRPDRRRLRHLAACAEALHSPLVSEHLAFVRAGGREAGHLLPVPRTAEALDIVCQNISEAQAALPVPLAIENIAALLEWPEAELDEAEFLRELVSRTGVGLLVDVANLWANARNHGSDPYAALDGLPLDHLAYVHAAGGAERDGCYYDTHLHPTPAGVLDLLGHLVSRAGQVPVLLERDGHYPPEDELDAELDALARTTARPAASVAGP